MGTPITLPRFAMRAPDGSLVAGRQQPPMALVTVSDVRPDVRRDRSAN